MGLILTTHGELEESQLVKIETTIDTENERTTSVEYCLRDCQGVAHQTGVADAPSHFCDQHVHRSVLVGLKEGLFAGSAIGRLPGFDIDAWARAYIENLIAKREESGCSIEAQVQLATDELAAIQRVAHHYPGLLLTVKDQHHG